MQGSPIPLTVIGGYLGSGKTTLVNHLLRHPGGRRIGVIVNDFGSLAIDAALLAEAADNGLVSLPNGCVCCTVGAGLHEALDAMATAESPPDHIVIEVSGVADPAVAAAWGTVPPFEPAGIIVLADATSVLQHSHDRYVGGEVTRQLAGADLVVITKVDACDRPRAEQVEAWVHETSGGAPSIHIVDGQVPPEVILGVRASGSNDVPDAHDAHDAHDDHYVSWSWTSELPVARRAVDRLVAELPVGVLRLKGRVRLDDDSWVLVQVVGRRADVATCPPADRSELVAISVQHPGEHPPTNPFELNFR